MLVAPRTPLGLFAVLYCRRRGTWWRLLVSEIATVITGRFCQEEGRGTRACGSSARWALPLDATWSSTSIANNKRWWRYIAL
ncbi:hypothetical protein FQR65_LT09953 [Abscondita terminalis]|nr:hypothetical protein FQR65_LT09953 [Abscondita terminalis]